MLDADVIIGVEKGRFDFSRWLASRGDEQFEIAAITVAELWHGVERASGAHRAAREAYLRRCLSFFPSFLTPNRPPIYMPGFGRNLQAPAK